MRVRIVRIDLGGGLICNQQSKRPKEKREKQAAKRKPPDKYQAVCFLPYNVGFVNGYYFQFQAVFDRLNTRVYFTFKERLISV